MNSMEDLSFGLSSIQMNNYPSAKIKIDQLFLEWIKVEGNAAMRTLLFEAFSNRSTTSDSLSSSNTAQKSESAKSRSPLSSNGLPRSQLTKKSPKKRTQSEMLSAKPNTTTPVVAAAVDVTRVVTSSETASEETEDHTSLRRRSNFDKIPVFYHPGKKNSYLHRVHEEDQLAKKLPEIEAFFKPFPNGIPVEKFVHVTKRLCGIPSFFNLPLCKRINERFGDADSGIPPPRAVGRAGRQPSGVKIKLKCFIKFWQAEIEPYDRIERFFRIIKRHEAEYIFKDDFVPFLQELLHFHPGLDFLEAHEEFQRKYALTVITRIFYNVNKSRSGKLSLREVRHSNLFNACMHVDEETDINKVVDYFSYEHFYVLYCKFFELDADKDSQLTKADLLKYGEHSLSEAIVDRIFQVGSKVFSDGQVGGFGAAGMSYPDFIFFMLSEEDKSSESALRYWFSCCDLDGDQKLNPEEMRHFYRSQIHRVTSLGQESINFHDVLCQMIDMIAPKNMNAITIADMIKPDKRMISGVLFDVLFNLHKFMRFETRDPFQEKLRREDVYHSDWDRFAHIEYNRLAQEEEGYDASMEVDMQQQLEESKFAQSGVEQLSSWSLNDDDEDSSSDADVGGIHQLTDEEDDDDIHFHDNNNWHPQSLGRENSTVSRR